MRVIGRSHGAARVRSFRCACLVVDRTRVVGSVPCTHESSLLHPSHALSGRHDDPACVRVCNNVRTPFPMPAQNSAERALGASYCSRAGFTLHIARAPGAHRARSRLPEEEYRGHRISRHHHGLTSGLRLSRPMHLGQTHQARLIL